jgi:hypothetical protein
MRVIAFIEDSDVIKKILRHLKCLDTFFDAKTIRQGQLEFSSPQYHPKIRYALYI